MPQKRHRGQTGRIGHILRNISALAAALLFAASCAPLSQDTRGDIYQVKDGSVTIIGPFATPNMDAYYTPYQEAQPTEAMVAQAREVCPGASFVYASPTPTDFDNLLYHFRC